MSDFLDIPIVLDPDFEPGTAEVHSDGEVVARIVNIQPMVALDSTEGKAMLDRVRRGAEAWAGYEQAVRAGLARLLGRR